MKKYLSLLLALALIFAVAACGNSDDKVAESDDPMEASEPALDNVATDPTVDEAAAEDEVEAPADANVAPGFVKVDGASNYVDILMDSGNHIVIQLDPTAAPVTVENFKKLVGEGFYDGLTFHRIIENFMIQGGDPSGNGTGGSDEEIEGEFADNGHDNPISHVRGVISMARALNPNSASSQFFIVHKDSLFLDGQNAAFGEVVYGMEEVDRLAVLDTDANDFPLETPVMTEVFFVNPQ